MIKIENVLLAKVSEQIKENKRAALVIITKVSGSSPAPEGSMMAVLEDGSILGTVGGGKLEAVVTEKAKQCLVMGKNEKYTFDLSNSEVENSLNMICGGQVEVFIKTFLPQHKLLIIGGGHIALELYKLGKFLGFYTVIFEDRQEFANRERFPEADEIIVGSIEKILKEYPINNSCYIVIVTRGHAYDERALKAVINTNAKYIGMIGSKNKASLLFKNMTNDKIPQQILDKVYSPIGLALGGDTPAEIAISIIAEILLVKNDGTLSHMKL